MYLAFALIFLSLACFAIEAALDISSYEELVQDPISPTSTLVGQLFFSASICILDIGVALSGVKGPFKYGSNSLRLILITSSKYISGFS